MNILDKEISVTEQQLINIIEDKIKEIDDTKLYFKLKKHKINYKVSGNTFKVLKVMIALKQTGLDKVTAHIIKYLTGIGQSSYQILHNLGDNHVLLKLRGTNEVSEWAISPLFIKELDGVI